MPHSGVCLLYATIFFQNSSRVIEALLEVLEREAQGSIVPLMSAAQVIGSPHEIQPMRSLDPHVMLRSTVLRHVGGSNTAQGSGVLHGE